MSNPILWQVGIGVLTLFFFFLVYQFTKTWRWLHVTVMFFVYCAAIAFMIYAAITLKTLDAWRQMVVKQQAQVADLRAQRDKLLHGDLLLLDQPEATLRDVQAALDWVMVDVGRVWRNTAPQGNIAPDGTVTVNTVPAGAAGGVAGPNRMEPGTVLYVFTEAPAPAPLAPTLTTIANPVFPRFYIGEFTVVTATDTTVTLRPTMPLTNSDRSLMGGTTWTLYETMPVDGHQLLAVDPFAKPDLTKDANTEPVFGVMTPDGNPQRIAQLMSRAAQRQGETDEQFLTRLAAVLDSYQRDGMRAAADDPPDNRWEKVRFLQAHEEDVDIATETSLSAMSSEDFFDRGLAEIAVLRRNDKAKFAKGDVGVFPSDYANQLVRDGVAESIEPIFVRRLNRYDYRFREIAQQMRYLEYELVQAQRNSDVIVTTIGETDEGITYREKEKAQLIDDRKEFFNERDQVKAYHARLKAYLDLQLAELSRLYRENYELESELDRLEQAVTSRINEQTRAALANTP